MPRGLQNAYQYVSDLEKAAAVYRRIGFTVGPLDDAGFNPERRIQIPGFCLTLIGPLNRDKVPPDVRIISAPEPMQDGLKGISLEDFEKSAAAAVSEAEWSVTVRLAPTEEEAWNDPAKRNAAFEIGDPIRGALTGIGFSVSDPYDWQQVWKPDLQQHVNSVNAIAGIVIVASNPADDYDFLSAFTGKRELWTTSDELTAQTQRGEISIMTPTAFHDRFGVVPPDVSKAARLAALRFAVRDGRALKTVLTAGALSRQQQAHLAVIPPDVAFGAAIVFEVQAENLGR